MSPGPAAPPRRDARANWFALLGCLLLVAAVYVPTALRAGFLNFDDNFFFGPENPEFRDGELGKILFAPIANAWLPLPHLSLYLDYVLGGGRPWLPHLSALLWQAGAGFMLWRLLRAIPVAPAVTWITVAGFLVHPALCESVAWVSGRKDVMCGVFTFAALAQAAALARCGARWRWLVLVLAAAAAMLSKATAVVLPLLAFAIALAQPGTSRRRFAAVLVLGFVAGSLAIYHQSIAAEQGTMVAGSVAGRLLHAPGVFWHYASTAVWPTGLNVLYPELPTLLEFKSESRDGVLLLLGFAAAVIVTLRRGPRLAAAGLLWFGAALLPFNTAYPATETLAADRYLYLALPGLVLAAAALAARVHARSGPWSLSLLLVPWLVLARARTQDFHDSERLWRQSLAAEPQSAVAHINLGAAIAELRPQDVAAWREQYDLAVQTATQPEHEFRAQLMLMRIALAAGQMEEVGQRAEAAIAAGERMLGAATDPVRRRVRTQHLKDALLEVFQPLLQSGREASARNCLLVAQRIAPEDPSVVAFGAALPLLEVQQELAARGAGSALAADDPRAVKALAELTAALAKHPDHAALNHAMGMWQSALGNRMPVLKYLRRAMNGQPPQSQYFVDAARFCVGNGAFELAQEYARDGMRISSDPQLRLQLALAMAARGLLDDAIHQLEFFVRVRPNDRDGRRMLAHLLSSKAVQRMNASDVTAGELQALVDRALANNPDEPKVELVLGKLCYDRRDFLGAIDHFGRAVILVPEYEDARTLLAMAYRDQGYARRFAGDDDGAVQWWQQFVAKAPEELDTEAVRMQLRGIWQRNERDGVQALRDGRRAEAVAAFRRCLRIDPEQHWISWLLASALFHEPGQDLREVDGLLVQAIEWMRAQQVDCSRAVLLRVLVLQRLGDKERARELGDAHLAALPADADPEAIEMLRTALKQ